jgi:ferredoxin--NADP+ reductase
MSAEAVLDPTEPVLPEAKMHVAMPNAPVAARIHASRLCMKGKSASFIRHVEIDVAGTPLEGSFRAGQSFGVIASGTDANGKPHKVRLYSLASPSWGEDGFGRVIATTPKRVIAEREPQKPADDPADHSLFLGVCSNWLCDRKAGDAVDVSGPNGKRFLTGFLISIFACILERIFFSFSFCKRFLTSLLFGFILCLFGFFLR